MSLLENIRKNPNSKRRWVVKYDSKERIKEIELLYKEHTYKGENFTDEELVKILEQNKNKKK
jgi:hypothetical protein